MLATHASTMGHDQTADENCDSVLSGGPYIPS